jgi:hypothetical protein
MRYKPNLRPHHLARLHRWATLWLKWFVAMLDILAPLGPPSCQDSAIAHKWLDAIEGPVLHIIWKRVAPHIKPANWRIYGPLPRRVGIHRSITGVRLRKALRDKVLRTRAAKLAQDLTALIAKQLRRLRRGMTRLLAILTRPQAAAMLAPCPCTATTPIADTS